MKDGLFGCGARGAMRVAAAGVWLCGAAVGEAVAAGCAGIEAELARIARDAGDLARVDEAGVDGAGWATGLAPFFYLPPAAFVSTTPKSMQLADLRMRFLDLEREAAASECGDALDGIEAARTAAAARF